MSFRNRWFDTNFYAPDDTAAGGEVREGGEAGAEDGAGEATQDATRELLPGGPKALFDRSGKSAAEALAAGTGEGTDEGGAKAPPEKEGAVKDAKAGEAAAVKAAEAKPAASDDDPAITIAGRTMRRSEWEKYAKDAETWRGQVQALTDKHMRLLEEQRAKAGGEEKPSGPLNPEQFVKFAQPYVEQGLKLGRISAEFAQECPLEAATLAVGGFAVVELQQQIRELTEQLQPIQKRDVALASEAQGYVFAQRFDATLDRLAASDQFFKVLAEGGARAQFKEAFAASRFGKADLGSYGDDAALQEAIELLWSHLNRAGLSAVAADAAKSAEEKREEQARTAKGEKGSGSGRPGKGPKFKDIYDTLHAGRG
jgi:hypothetical protein